jgi:pimeloyl-ACP methyl ester carboxylesterase
MMLTYVRRHPASVRSLVLDSVLPLEVNFDEVSAANLLRSLNLVFDVCAIDRECGAANPNLRQKFLELVARADREPLPIDAEATVRGAQVVDAIYSALHSTQAIPVIPRIITNAANGNYAALQQLVRENLGPSRFTWGLRLSVWCSEEMPFEDPQRIASQASPTLGLGGLDAGGPSPALCRAWNVAPAPAVENEPVKSDVPVLIFSGEFDPDTPPEWGRRLLDAMPNARFVELRGRSHGSAFNACGSEIIMAFLRAPRGPLAVDCALRTRGARFYGVR